MEEDLKEKEFYRGSIMGMLENIDNIDILSYIYIVVKDIATESGVEWINFANIMNQTKINPT